MSDPMSIPVSRPAPKPPPPTVVLAEVLHDLSPAVLTRIDRYLTILESQQMTAAELQAYADAKTQEVVTALTATITAEHDEVMAAIAANTQGLSDAEIKSALDAQASTLQTQLSTAISGIFVAVPPPTP
jgi:hypothetical protein